MANNLPSLVLTKYCDTQGTVANGGTIKTTDYTLQIGDNLVGVDCSGGSVLITIPDISTFTRNYKFRIYRLDNCSNTIEVRCAIPTQSFEGTNYSSVFLARRGSTVCVQALANVDGAPYPTGSRQWWLERIDIQIPSPRSPEITTQKPSISDPILTMNGYVNDLAGNTSVDAYFKYRIKGAGSWSQTGNTTVTSNNTSVQVTADITPDLGNDWDVQFFVSEIGGDVTSGSILDTDNDYYGSLAEATADGLQLGFRLQESAGVDTTGIEVVNTPANDLICAGGVTIGSDIINTNTIYKRIFGTLDYGESPVAIPFATGSWTVLVQVKISTVTLDHTIFSFGRNVFCLGGYYTYLRCVVGNGTSGYPLYSPSGFLPFAGIKNIFIVVNRSLGVTYMYECTPTTRSEIRNRANVPTQNGTLCRLGRGVLGDSYYSDTEYLDNGEIRSGVWVWDRILTEQTMKDICKSLDTYGGQVVG